MELLKEVAPHLRQVGFLFNPDSTTATAYFYGTLEAASAKLGVNVMKVPVPTPDAIESLIKELGSQPDHGLIVQPDTFLAYHARQIVDLAAHYRLPAIYPFDFYQRTVVSFHMVPILLISSVVRPNTSTEFYEVKSRPI